MAYARTGTGLAAGHARVSLGTNEGFAPTTVKIAYPPGMMGYPNGTLHDNSTSKSHTTRSAFEFAIAPFFSLEAAVAYSPLGRCEAGVAASLVHETVELRCGTLPGDLGPIEAALSLAGGIQNFSPRGLEARTGLDLSLAGIEISPVVDVYGGYVQATRPVLYDNRQPEWWGWDTLLVERTEWRLSVPLGIAYRPQTGSKDPVSTWIVAIVPEFTLGHGGSRIRHERDADVNALATLTQNYAVFIVFSGSGDVRVR